MSLEDFAREVGPIDAGPVWVEGNGTRSAAPAHVRTVRAPNGITFLRADEMIVECGAGTPIDELQAAVSEVGQYVNLPTLTRGSGTVGGALAMGHSDVRRLGRGAVRDAVLRLRCVGHDGSVITAGGSTVKNVSGFDLCRLMVGARGSLGFMGEVLLRTRPLPRRSTWWRASVVDSQVVTLLMGTLYRPAAVLWNGSTVMICLEGHEADIAVAVDAVQSHVGVALAETSPLDVSDFPHRWSVAPGEIPITVARTPELCWAEMGVGTLHHRQPQPVPEMSLGVAAITRRLLESFDPTRRLNPGQAPRHGAMANH